MKTGIICQACGVEAPVKYVELHQNIGALVMRFHRSVKGNLCKNCINKNFWPMTGITFAVGWLGLISLIIAPIFVINNLVRYVGALGMPPVPPGARPPELNETVFAQFLPYAQASFDRLAKGGDINDVAREIGPSIGLTPGQVVRCMVTLAQQQRQQQQNNKPTGGFPVIPLSKDAMVQPSNVAPPPLPQRTRS